MRNPFKRKGPKLTDESVASKLSRDLSGHQDIAWAKLPVELRQQAVDRLREVCGPATLGHLVDQVDDPWFHFGTGMAIRNLLRSDHSLSPKPKTPPILDKELPPLPEIYGQDVSNWDDFYVQALEAAAGARPVL